MRLFTVSAFVLLATSIVCGDTRVPVKKNLPKSTFKNLKSDCIQPMEADVMNYHGCGFPAYDIQVFEEKQNKHSQLK